MDCRGSVSNAATGNNRMAAIVACKLVPHAESRWLRNHWRNAAKDPVANMALWQRLLAAAKPHQVEWRWVRGHAGDIMNERADTLATAARLAGE